jgi:hypothetical protein
MPTIKLKKILLITIFVVIHPYSFANIEKLASIKLEIPLAQVLIISQAVHNENFDPIANLTKSTTWTIKSNNAVDIDFSGTTPSNPNTPTEILTTDSNLLIRYPLLHKQKVDAKNQLIDRNYDYLETSFGVKINNYNSTNKRNEPGSDYWNVKFTGSNISGVTGISSNLVDNAGNFWGAIMPNDESGEFDVTLYTHGVADDFDQSGNYTMVVIINISANEKI